MLLRKGKLTRSRKKEMMIVSEDNRTYIVDDPIVTVWSMCDGNQTEETIADNLSINNHIERSKVLGVVSDIVERLKKIGLLQEVASILPDQSCSDG
ncbi:MAG: hypothetical protein GTN39_02935 [Candidatus Aenigmarchaeota archaeon]|nr:hypothetical protein [Candidatus Aenigmarchaeota archaeon]